MPHDVGRSGRVPRGIDTVGFVGFSTHADVVVDGDIAAMRRAYSIILLETRSVSAE